MARAVLITNSAAARTTPLAVEAVRDALRATGWQLAAEAIITRNREGSVLRATPNVHPYEEIAYDLYPLRQPSELTHTRSRHAVFTGCPPVTLPFAPKHLE